MSSRKRKPAQPTLPGVSLVDHGNNYYTTPPAVVRSILPELRSPRWTTTGPDQIRTFLDPGCGKGEIASVVLAEWPDMRGLCVELDSARATVAKEKGLTVVVADWGAYATETEYHVGDWGSLGPPELIITNPPFSWPDTPEGKAKELALGDLWSFWVRKCLERVAEGGEVAALGRLGVLAAAEGTPRDELFEGGGFLRSERWDLYALAWRPSFGGAGTDSAPYGWFVFGPTRTGRIRRLHREPEDKPRRRKL